MKSHIKPVKRTKRSTEIKIVEKEAQMDGIDLSQGKIMEKENGKERKNKTKHISSISK